MAGWALTRPRRSPTHSRPNVHRPRSAERKWSVASQWLLRFTSQVEVGIGILLVVELLTPYRNLILVFIYWQYLQLRYTLSPNTKVRPVSASAGVAGSCPTDQARPQAAFGAVDRRIVGLVNHRMCPALLRAGYMKLRGFLSSMAQPRPQAGEQQAAARPSCVVM